jgi:hypothetical protein
LAVTWVPRRALPSGPRTLPEITSSVGT